MPGLIGILAPGDQTPTLDRMLAGLAREPFYQTGRHRDEAHGLTLGWVVHPGTYASQLPFWNADHTVGLFFTGEHFAEPTEDGAALVRLYEEHGLTFLERLNGWFSGVLVDTRRGEVTLFNDRYGLNRVYYHEAAGAVYFSFEAKSLMNALPALRRLDPAGVGEYLTCGCVLQNRTLFAGISLLPGAASWTFMKGRLVKKETYFQRQTWENLPTLSEAEYYEKFKACFARISPRYYRQGGPVALSLTGGLDGRMILAWADRALPCYTFGGPYRDCVDLKLARRMAEICGCSHQTIPVGGEFLREFPALAEQTIAISDGAMDVSGAVELYMNRLAREIAPVRLTGNYGSEILRGNVAFRPGTIPSELFDAELVRAGQAAGATYAAESTGNRLSFIAFKQVPWHHYSRLSIERSQLIVRAPYLDNELVATTYQAPAAAIASKQPALQLIADGRPALAAVPTDRALRLHPRPVVTPVQHWYQEFTFRAEYAYDYGMPQWLVKVDRLARWARPERLWLGRHKFYHFRVWYRDELAAYVREMLLDPRTLGRGYLRAGQVEAMVAAHVSGRGNYTTEIHQLLSLELIQRNLLGG